MQNNDANAPLDLEFGALFEPIIDIPGGSFDGFADYEAVEIIHDDHVITTEYMVVSVN